MIRKNACGVEETAEFNINRDVFEKEHSRIFGESVKKFCDKCDLRLSFCECKEENEQENK